MSKCDESGKPESPRPQDELFTKVYAELRRIAARHLEGERVGHTLQPTALVHEAWLRLSDLDRMEFKDRTHFIVAASGAIRRVLVDHARARAAGKRGAGGKRLTLAGMAGSEQGPELDLLALDDAVRKLAALDERGARVVTLRYFGGLTIAETARALGVGTTTVEDAWAFARSWLRREMETGGAS